MNFPQVPSADFSKGEGKVKTPSAINLKAEPMMSTAGIWGHWRSSDSRELIDSFSIVTTVNSFMVNIHTRTPAILSEEQLGPSKSKYERYQSASVANARLLI